MKTAQSYCEILNEILADFGMVVGLKCILEAKKGYGIENLTPDVNHAFSTMIESMLSWLPNNQVARTALQHFVVRWAMQHRVVSPVRQFDAWRQVFVRDFVDSVGKHNGLSDSLLSQGVASFVENVIEEQHHFGILEKVYSDEDESQMRLSDVLRGFLQDDDFRVWGPRNGSPQDEILDCFFEVWSQAVESRGSSRIDPVLAKKRGHFAFLLWAKSQKLVIERMFLPAE